MTQPPGQITAFTRTLQWLNPLRARTPMRALAAGLAYGVFLGMAGTAVYLFWYTKPRSMRGRVDLSTTPPPSKPAAATASYSYKGAAESARNSALQEIGFIEPNPLLGRRRNPYSEQPIDTRINRLAAKKDRLEKALYQAITTAGADHVESTTAAKNLMELLFTLSSLILDESPLWRAKNSRLTFAWMIGTPDNFYHQRSFWPFIDHYHQLRSGNRLAAENGKIVLRPNALSEDAERERVAKFYTEGSLEYHLRMLFNDLCDRAKHYADPAQMKTDPAQPEAERASAVTLQWSSDFTNSLTKDTDRDSYKAPESATTNGT
jgi:hypothetical protein